MEDVLKHQFQTLTEFTIKILKGHSKFTNLRKKNAGKFRENQIGYREKYVNSMDGPPLCCQTTCRFHSLFHISRCFVMILSHDFPYFHFIAKYVQSGQIFQLGRQVSWRMEVQNCRLDCYRLWAKSVGPNGRVSWDLKQRLHPK